MKRLTRCVCSHGRKPYTTYIISCIKNSLLVLLFFRRFSFCSMLYSQRRALIELDMDALYVDYQKRRNIVSKAEHKKRLGSVGIEDTAQVSLS